MKFLSLVFLLLTNAAFAEGPSYLIDARLGFIMDRIDTEAAGRWEHDTAASNAVYLGAHLLFPQAWEELKFFAGPDVAYYASHEKIGDSRLNTTMFAFFASGGLIYRPEYLGGGWGLEFKTGGQLYADKRSTITSPSLSVNVGRSTNNNLGFLVSLAALYASTPNWQLRLSFDNYKVLALGVAYAF